MLEITSKRARQFAQFTGNHMLIVDSGVCALRDDEDTPDQIGVVFRVSRENEPHVDKEDYFVMDLSTAVQLAQELITHAQLAYPHITDL